MVSAAALVTGASLGTGYAGAATYAIGRSTPVRVVVPFASLSAVLLLAALAGVLAGIAPARRAARLDVLAAIASE